MRYKMEIKKCKHNCLLNSPKIKEEIKKLDESRKRLIANLEGDGIQTIQKIHI